MVRFVVGACALMSITGCLGAGDAALAAGPGGVRAVSGGGQFGARQFGPHQAVRGHPGFHRRAALGVPRDRGRSRFFLGGGGLYPYVDRAETIVRRDDPEVSERRIDRNDFAHMAVRTGIPYPPTPTPVIYRIEGGKARPDIRIIWVGAEPEDGRRRR